MGNQRKRKCAEVNNVAEMHSAAKWDKKGLDMSAKGNYAFAIDAFTKSIDLNPKDASTYYCRAGAYAALGEHSKAIDDYSKVIEFNPDDCFSYSRRGYEYFQLKNFDKTIED